MKWAFDEGVSSSSSASGLRLIWQQTGSHSLGYSRLSSYELWEGYDLEGL